MAPFMGPELHGLFVIYCIVGIIVMCNVFKAKPTIETVVPVVISPIPALRGQAFAFTGEVLAAFFGCTKMVS